LLASSTLRIRPSDVVARFAHWPAFGGASKTFITGQAKICFTVVVAAPSARETSAGTARFFDDALREFAKSCLAFFTSCCDSGNLFDFCLIMLSGICKLFLKELLGFYFFVFACLRLIETHERPFVKSLLLASR